MRRLILRAPFSSLAAIAVASFLIGAALATSWFWPRAQVEISPIRLNQTQYPLINPLLICGDNHKDIDEDKALEKTLQPFINDRIAKGKADDMSVYVLNYSTGAWTGINENDPYDPASLTKVPLMIAYFIAAEKNPSILSQPLSFTGTDQNIGEYYSSPSDIKPNKTYTVDQLISSMITNSDNTAAVLLQLSINPNSLAEVFSDLSLNPPPSDPSQSYISAKQYAYFFRVLYNSTYLGRTYSEKALELLSAADFPEGIRAGIPAGVEAAQKFGERTINAPDGSVIDRQLHDCGIVYKPNKPYLVCIMSRSKTADFPTLAKNIADLSALVYANI